MTMTQDNGPAGTHAARKVDWYRICVLVLAILVIFLVVYPIGGMLVKIFLLDAGLNLGAALSVLQEYWLPAVLRDTFLIVGLTTVGAVFVGFVLAWLNERTDANLGFIGLVMPIVPLFVPGVALAIGWVFLAAPRVGFINAFLAGLPGIGRDGLNLRVDIYSWAGLVWVYVLNAVPAVYLLVAAALRNVNSELEEASRLSGAGLLRTFRKVSLPIVRPALIAAALLTIISTFAMFSIPVIIATNAGIDVLPVRVVSLLTGTYPPRMDQAVVLSLIMLVAVAIAWHLQQRVTKSGHFVAVGGKASNNVRISMGAWRRPVQIAMVLYLMCTSVIPLVALIVVALQPFWTARIDPSVFTLDNFRQVIFDTPLMFDAFRNSLTIAAAGATIGMAAAAVIAVYNSRHSSRIAFVADTALKWPATVPNLVIALGFLVAFAGPPFHLAGTVLLLMVAMIVIYIPVGSIAANAAVAQVGRDLTEASHVAGAGEGRTVRRVVLPLAMPGFVGGWALVFVYMTGDLSAAAILSGFNNPVIGYAILETWQNGSFSLLAAFATIMVAVVSVIVLLTVRMFGMGALRKL